MKKVIYVISTFLVVCFIASISVNASTSSSRYLYINNVSVSTGDGYTTSGLNKTEKGSQYIISKVSKSFYAYLYGYDTNGTGPEWNDTRYKISANERGIIQDNSSLENWGYGIGTTKLKLVSAGLFNRTFRGAWIPDEYFYNFLNENGGI